MIAVPRFPMIDDNNLGYHGWRRWRDDPCKRIDNLHWPLHAIGDASCPMHALGTTGQGHRPFEDALAARLADLGVFPEADDASREEAFNTRVHALLDIVTDGLHARAAAEDED